MTKKRIALVVEDVRFRQFLEPAVERIAEQAGLAFEWGIRTSISGCRPNKLKEVVGRVRPSADIVIVGADADGRGHVTRGAGHKRKRNALLDLLTGQDCVSVAVAQPSVEAWLFCHPNSFAVGLGAALGVKFDKPAEWPVPRSEREAKEMLGQLVRGGTHASLPRAGFEFAREIVGRMPLDGTDSVSLTDWVRELRRVLAGVP